MTSDNNPLISICIPTYKGARLLPETINSVLSQSYSNFELLIIDDNSPDDTQSVVSQYSDPRIRYINNSRNLGPQGNWNRCLELAQGQYYKLLPQDDLLAPDCLKEQVAILEADTDGSIVLVFGSRQIIDFKGHPFLKRGLSNTKPGRIAGLELIRNCVRAGTNLIGEPGNGLIRRELIDKVGSYDASYPFLIDLDFWFRVLLHGDAFYMGKWTSSFRVSQTSWSVALGSKQFQDLRSFIKKFSRDLRFGISLVDSLLGLVRGLLNTVGRLLIYRFLFFFRRERI